MDNSHAFVQFANNLATLPNVDGFAFIGIRHDNSRADCVVIKNPMSGMHYIGGDAQYNDLKGWIRK